MHNSNKRKIVSTYAILFARKLASTSREQTFDPRLKWALVPEFFAPGTRNTFSLGWWLQPGLKVPAQRLPRCVRGTSV